MSEPPMAPELTVSQWFNTPAPISLADLHGQVVVLHAFQMLCPGCVERGLPQAQRIAQLFPRDQVAVIGLHTVFEHHEAMMPVSLAAFIHEYQFDFPVGIDRPATDGPLPQTMAIYRMKGTPTLILIDRRGRLRQHRFGVDDDLRVGAAIATLLAEVP